MTVLCPKCNASIKTEAGLKQHMIAKHSKHVCGQCDHRSFGSEKALSAHMRDKHGGTGALTGKLQLWCIECDQDVDAQLITGGDVYPHRRDLADLPFWQCPTCKHFVGCHHKTADRTKPLGCIPNAMMKVARGHIHRILDPLWRNRLIGRRELYEEIGRRIGDDDYHTAELRSIEGARRVYAVVREIADELKAEKAIGSLTQADRAAANVMGGAAHGS